MDGGKTPPPKEYDFYEYDLYYTKDGNARKLGIQKALLGVGGVEVDLDGKKVRYKESEYNKFLERNLDATAAINASLGATLATHAGMVSAVRTSGLAKSHNDLPTNFETEHFGRYKGDLRKMFKVTNSDKIKPEKDVLFNLKFLPKKFINAKDNKGQTLLHHAIALGYGKVAEYLIKNGAEIYGDNEGNTPLHIAVQNNKQNMVILILSHSKLASGCKDLKNKQGMTPLHIAVQNQHYYIVRDLLSKKANVNVPDNNKNTPLDLAAKRVEEDLDRIREGAEGAYDILQDTKYTKKFIRLLLDYGAKINTDKLDRTKGSYDENYPNYFRHIFSESESMFSERMPMSSKVFKSVRDADVKHNDGQLVRKHLADLMLASPVINTTQQKLRDAKDIISGFPAKLDQLDQPIRDDFDCTLLHIAIVTQNLKLVEILLKKGADIYKPSTDINILPLDHPSSAFHNYKKYVDEKNEKRAVAKDAGEKSPLQLAEDMKKKYKNSPDVIKIAKLLKDRDEAIKIAKLLKDHEKAIPDPKSSLQQGEIELGKKLTQSDP